MVLGTACSSGAQRKMSDCRLQQRASFEQRDPPYAQLQAILSCGGGSQQGAIAVPLLVRAVGWRWTWHSVLHDHKVSYARAEQSQLSGFLCVFSRARVSCRRSCPAGCFPRWSGTSEAVVASVHTSALGSKLPSAIGLRLRSRRVAVLAALFTARTVEQCTHTATYAAAIARLQTGCKRTAGCAVVVNDVFDVGNFNFRHAAHASSAY